MKNNNRPPRGGFSRFDRPQAGRKGSSDGASTFSKKEHPGRDTSRFASESTHDKKPFLHAQREDGGDRKKASFGHKSRDGSHAALSAKSFDRRPSKKSFPQAQSDGGRHAQNDDRRDRKQESFGHKGRDGGRPSSPGTKFEGRTSRKPFSREQGADERYARNDEGRDRKKGSFGHKNRDGARSSAFDGEKRPFKHAKPHGAGAHDRDRGGGSAFRPSKLKKPDRRAQLRGAAPVQASPSSLAPMDNVSRDTPLLWGLHAVRAAWLNPKRRCVRLWGTEAGLIALEATRAEAKEALLNRPDPKKVDRAELDRLTPAGSVHQGLVLETPPLPEIMLHELIEAETPPDLLVALDQVTDPHNIGAIIRSAAALGAAAVIMTERNAPGLTGVLAKSASGAIEHVPLLHIVNLARAIEQLQEAGYWCVGLAEEGEKELAACDLTRRTLIILGAEGEGLRQLTRKKCDELARLPTGGSISSLNVSNAAAVALYEARRQKAKVS